MYVLHYLLEERELLWSEVVVWSAIKVKSISSKQEVSLQTAATNSHELMGY